MAVTTVFPPSLSHFIVNFVLAPSHFFPEPSSSPSSSDSSDYLDEEYVDLDWADEEDRVAKAVGDDKGKRRRKTGVESSGDGDDDAWRKRRKGQKVEDDDEGGDDDDDAEEDEEDEEREVRQGSGDGPGTYGGTLMGLGLLFLRDL